MTTVALPQTGGCACGSLRYALNAAPLLAYACHCHGCQKRSGSAFTLTIVIRTEDREVAGDAEIVERVTNTGRRVQQSFCPDCRAHVFSCAPAAPEFMSLRAGSLDDASWITPICQSFVEDAIPWAVIPGVASVRWADFDFEEQGRLWRQQAPQFRLSPPTPPGPS